MARIPVETRGPLIALSVQDHYVEVRTARNTLLLMRLSDAMQEARAADGLQIHRRTGLRSIRSLRSSALETERWSHCQMARSAPPAAATSQH